MPEAEKVDGDDVKLTHKQAGCLDTCLADLDLSAVTGVALVFAFIPVLGLPDAGERGRSSAERRQVQALVRRR